MDWSHRPTDHCFVSSRIWGKCTYHDTWAIIPLLCRLRHRPKPNNCLKPSQGNFFIFFNLKFNLDKAGTLSQTRSHLTELLNPSNLIWCGRRCFKINVIWNSHEQTNTWIWNMTWKTIPMCVCILRMHLIPVFQILPEPRPDWKQWTANVVWLHKIRSD